MIFELINPDFRCKKESKDFIYVPKKEAKNERQKKRNAETEVLGVKPPVTKKGLWNERGVNTHSTTVFFCVSLPETRNN